MSKLIGAFALAFLLLPGFASAKERCHGENAPLAGEAAIAGGHDAGHGDHAAHAAGVEEVPQTIPASAESGHGAEGDCPHHPGVVHTCSTQILLTKCGMHGCCIKNDVPIAGSGASPKIAPEMAAIDSPDTLNPLSATKLAASYLLEKLSNHYPPIPRPPAA